LVNYDLIVSALGCLVDSAEAGHSDDCQNDCQLCQDIQSAKNILDEIDTAEPE
jgi:hypothetical protein